jgi:hypothetical protein
MAGALTLTHNATSLILPNNGNNITTATGDSFMAESLGSGNWKVYIYQKADGTILGVNGIINGGTGQSTAAAGIDALNQASEVSLASASTVNIGAAASQQILITGTTTITAFDTVAAGTKRYIRFSGVLTLTHNATTLILPNNGSNIGTANGDTMLAISEGSGNWRIRNYQKVNGQALVDNTGGAGSVYVNAVSVSNPNFIGSQFTATTTTNISLSNTLTITNSGQVFNTVYLGTATNVTIDPFLGSYSWAPSDNCRWQFATNTLSDTNKEYNIRLFLQAPSAGKVVTNVVDTYTVEGRWDALVAGLNTFNISYKAGTVRISHEQAFLDASQVILANGSTNIDTAFGSMQTQLNTKGDFSSNTGTSVDGEVVVFSGTAGKTGKRATGTGVAHLTSGVLSVGTTTIAEGGSGQTTANAAEDAFQQVAEVSLASASTTDLGAQTSQKVLVTGTTTITSFGTVASGTVRDVRFNGALTLTHNATSLILPTGANITTVAGDILRAISEGSGNWRIRYYTRADGTSLQGYATVQEEGSGIN